MAVVFNQKFCNGFLDFINAGDGLLDGGDVLRVLLDDDHWSAALDVLHDLEASSEEMISKSLKVSQAALEGLGSLLLADAHDEHPGLAAGAGPAW